MTKGIKLLILAALTLSVLSCNKEEVRPTNKLQLRFENKSQDKIKDFTFQGRSIGTISAESKTAYYTFEEIHVIDNYVSEHASVKSEYGQIETWLMNNPDADWTTITAGKHTIKLTLFYGCGIGFSMNLSD